MTESLRRAFEFKIALWDRMKENDLIPTEPELPRRLDVEVVPDERPDASPADTVDR